MPTTRTTFLHRDAFVAAAGGHYQAVDLILAADLPNGPKLALLTLFRTDGPNMRRRPGRHMLAKRMNRHPSPVGRDLEMLKKLGWVALIPDETGAKHWAYQLGRTAPSEGSSHEKRTAPSRPGGGAPEGSSTAPSEGTDVEDVALDKAPPNPQRGLSGSLRSSDGNGNDSGADELRLAREYFAALTDADRQAALDAAGNGRLKLQDHIRRDIAALTVWRKRTTP